MRLRSARRRIKKRENKVERNDESEQSESIGVPSTRWEIKRPLMRRSYIFDNLKKSKAKLKWKTRKQRQLLSESGFVLCTVPPPLSRDGRIKMKKS